MSRLDDILVRKGRLSERIRYQRSEIAGYAQGLRPLFMLADCGTAAVNTLRAHPGWVVVAAGTVLVLKPRRTLRWLRRSFVLWRTWRWARNTIAQYL